MSDDWFSLALISTLLMTVQALLQRLLTDAGVSVGKVTNVQMIGGALLVLGLSLGAHDSVQFSVSALLFLMMAALCSAVGHRCELVSIRAGPNPGYPTGIVSATGVVTTFAAPLLGLGAAISIQHWVGAAVVLLGSLMLCFSTKTREAPSSGAPRWVISATGAMISFSTMTLLIRAGSATLSPLALTTGLLFIGGLFSSISPSKSIELTSSKLALLNKLLLYGVLPAVFGLGAAAQIVAIAHAPNPGLVGAILAAKSPLIAVAAPFLSRTSSLSWPGLVALALVLVGVVVCVTAG